MQGCNGVGLMLGYTNPWATWIRKQCEISPLAVQGVYDIVMSMLVDVPFAKCVCIDSRGSNFKRYAQTNDTPVHPLSERFGRDRQPFSYDNFTSTIRST